ncbi:hypothetical protein [Epibacterium ulvae]|uniref:hypothetical protein n=1 Tax=Epibacterium ulvae TaxID=1156985 RepID=UPI002492E1F3|nr:hypothetical protein [Epibacterium ulvae]
MAAEENRHQQKAQTAWAGQAPEWVMGLARQCDATSQNAVAKELQYSAAVISTVIANRYPGNMDGVEERYRAQYENQTVVCPVRGEIRLKECRRWQEKSKKLITSNGHTVAMFHACRRCGLNQRQPPKTTD